MDWGVVFSLFIAR